jgi:hypothetical protein
VPVRRTAEEAVSGSVDFDTNTPVATEFGAHAGVMARE